ncbi:hypothetical protein PF008_g15920 [Phytophthora fragariae]|uniref:Uncharacterized protein n=1 Tax=Phytophthora fragariae TaxID=53985 RepID=A0A6G0RDK5_9STRA|nr:hypothetical protein PF008_g15920 [Phytophthora fragariae]
MRQVLKTDVVALTVNRLQELAVLRQVHVVADNKGVSQFFLDHRAALPVKDNLAGISKVPFETTFVVKNIKRGVRDTGIFPLSLEMMLNKMVGGKPAANPVTLRYHSMMVPHFEGRAVDARTQAALKRRKLDLDTLNVVHLSLKMRLEPQPQHRPKGDFMDEKVSGGKLLSYDEMLDEQRAKDEAKRAKQDAKQAVNQARESAKLSRPTEVKGRIEMALHVENRESAHTFNTLSPP